MLFFVLCRIKSLLSDDCNNSRLKDLNKGISEPVGSVGERISHLASVIQARMNINLEPELDCKSVSPEIEYFPKTGNCEPVAGSSICINSTLLKKNHDNDDFEVWKYFSSPFDAYFPISLKEQLLSNLEITSAYNYCKTKFQSLISHLKLHKRRITSYFYADCLEMCLKTEAMKNRFHVVHCSDCSDRIGHWICSSYPNSK